MSYIHHDHKQNKRQVKRSGYSHELRPIRLALDLLETFWNLVASVFEVPADVFIAKRFLILTSWDWGASLVYSFWHYSLFAQMIVNPTQM